MESPLSPEESTTPEIFALASFIGVRMSKLGKSLTQMEAIALAEDILISQDEEVASRTMTTRAKFRCASVERFSENPEGVRVYRFNAVTDTSTPENERYARYTPIGELKMHVDNPAVSFEVGKDYYLDFTPAE